MIDDDATESHVMPSKLIGDLILKRQNSVRDATFSNYSYSKCSNAKLKQMNDEKFVSNRVNTESRIKSTFHLIE